MNKQPINSISAIALAFAVAVTVLILPQYAMSGDLEPSSGPAPTMHSLEEIYNKLKAIENSVTGGCTDCTAPVPRTGQTNSYATGDDGEKKTGIVWPDPRFTDIGDGTVRDNLTGLIWLKDETCYEQKDWAAAIAFGNSLAAGQCNLADGSTAGQWRLPNIRELQSLVDYSTFNPALPPGHPFTYVGPSWHFSSTTNAASTNTAWVVEMYSGQVVIQQKTESHWVLYVRTGQ